MVYTAKVYVGDRLIAEKEGNDIDKLFAWMIAQAQNGSGRCHGSIVNNDTQEVIRTFKTNSVE
ncbi:hypothetical protein DIZ81_05030 [Legionella taurinensis]|uniref:Uncharacterized protein n=2 Tax=Legionella taurinensis TaxID=70611 RepID=A0A3A5L5P7_9GAMM|nr:hypothetical protein [Legionella taurinensis]PUT41442.1 hypothetical protein DB744_05030 [Legionella taurinensis]PUT42681.1 hypothetical protein DB746_07365 [Legionella taurinensis]PUT46709.1 hypothetical protein DB743_04765 [Legionella taurinensis]PUT47358.1 hypothetical protein DB745_08445 [Legionella taurinensis]RJT48200.1 hypothetical protein D6J04_03635 [Legionella taurinensis]